MKPKLKIFFRKEAHNTTDVIYSYGKNCSGSAWVSDSQVSRWFVHLLKKFHLRGAKK